MNRRAGNLHEAAPRAPSGAAPRLQLPEIPWGRVAGWFAVVAVLLLVFYRFGDIDAVHAEAARLHAGLAFVLLVLLPLVGFPVSILHVAAGIRFGAPLGLALVSLSILLQLLACYGLVKLWRHRFAEAAWLKRLRRRVPAGAHRSVCLLTVLLPGAPYAGINYVLPLLGVSLGNYLLVCLPIHTLRSTVTVLLGDQSQHLTAGRLAALLAYALAVLGALWWTYRRVRSRLEDQPPAADDQKQPA